MQTSGIPYPDPSVLMAAAAGFIIVSIIALIMLIGQKHARWSDKSSHNADPGNGSGAGRARNDTRARAPVATTPKTPRSR